MFREIRGKKKTKEKNFLISEMLQMLKTAEENKDYDKEGIVGIVLRTKIRVTKAELNEKRSKK